MSKLKPVIARTPEELAGALGLPAVAAKERQVQHILLKKLKQVVRRQKITHAEIAKRAGTSRTRVTAIQNDDLEHVSSDLLIRILASLGYRVRVSVVRRPVRVPMATHRSSLSSNRLKVSRLVGRIGPEEGAAAIPPQ